MSIPEVSVVICTYNRSRDLAFSLTSVLDQIDGPPYELIVVDNNSTDDTWRVVEKFQAVATVPLRYVFEPQQGLPCARNAGIRAARAPIIAFTDDDIVVATDWVRRVKRAFDEHPEFDCIGGRVIPRWPAAGKPSWLTTTQLAPLALQDKGERPIVVDRHNAAPCLIGANFSFRASAFNKAGLFDPQYTRTQDREMQLRLWRAGGKGLYLPDIVTYVDVPEERLTKAYFRLWYTRAGRFHSRMGLLDILDRDGRMVAPPPPELRLLGAPAYLYSQLAHAALECLIATVKRNKVAAFYYENRARYLAAYIRERWRQEGPLSSSRAAVDVARFVRYRFERKPIPPVAA